MHRIRAEQMIRVFLLKSMRQGYQFATDGRKSLQICRSDLRICKDRQLKRNHQIFRDFFIKSQFSREVQEVQIAT